MEKLIKSFPVIIALLVGGYLGYYLTNQHDTQKEASSDKTDSTAICRLELRDGNRGDVKNEYIALLEYRTGDGGEAFCKKYMPTDNLPEDTYEVTLNSLYSDDEYDEQMQIGE